MENDLNITFTFTFANGSRKIFPLVLDKSDLSLRAKKTADLPLWVILNYHQCENCPLDVSRHQYCPVAVNIAGIVEEFKDFVSHEKARVTVAVEERIYAKDTTVQQGLTPLLGIIMTTTGCPVMEQLKPMVRFHLPFASLTETVFRMSTMFLMAQFLRSLEGKSAVWSLDGLTKVYTEVGKVNRDFTLRLRVAAKKDANVNALVNLDCFATMVPLAADDTLREIRPYFKSYLE
jgi:hypothetical protein